MQKIENLYVVNTGNPKKMLKGLVKILLAADAKMANVNLVDKNSYIRYGVPFMQHPKFDNKQIIQEYTNSVIAVRSAVPYSLQPRVSTGLHTLNDMDTSLLKLIIKDNVLVEDPEHKSKRGKSMFGFVFGFTAGLYGTVASDFFMSHPFVVMSVYAVTTMKMLSVVNKYDDINTELKSATDGAKIAFEFAQLAVHTPLLKVAKTRDVRTPGKLGKCGMRKFRIRARK